MSSSSLLTKETLADGNSPGALSSAHVVWGRVEGSGFSSSNSSSAPGGQPVPSSAAKSGPGAGVITAKLLKWRINPDSIHFVNQSFDSSPPSSSSQTEGARGPKVKGSSKPSNGEGSSSAKGKMPQEDLLHDLFDSATSESDTSGQEKAGAQLQKAPPAGGKGDLTLERVPRDANGELTSIGSALHDQGECKACIFITSAQGCTNGVECPFCHLPHQAGRRQNKLRPCKGKRDRYRKLLTRLTRQIENDPHSFSVDQLDLPTSISQNESTKAKLVARMEMVLEEVKAREAAAGKLAGTAAAGAGAAAAAPQGAAGAGPTPPSATPASTARGGSTRTGIMSL